MLTDKSGMGKRKNIEEVKVYGSFCEWAEEIRNLETHKTRVFLLI